MNAVDRAALKEGQRFYRKEGRKYVPVNDPYAYDGLREGFWLIKVSKGCTSIRQCVFPAKAELAAAAKLKEDQLVDIIRKASEARPTKKPLSLEMRKDWEDFVKKHGDSFSTLEYPSFSENARQIIEALLE